jgi:hypothetical protein
MATEHLKIELLDDHNYGTWSVRMKAVLTTRGLWDAATGKAGVADDKVQQALALITLGVSDAFLATIGAVTTAAEAWSKLEGIFKGKSAARIMHLRKDLAELSKIPQESIVKYIGRARGIMNDLVSAGHTITETDVVWSVLSGLSRAYSTTVEILSNGPEESFTLDKIMAKLVIVESRVSRREQDDSKALVAGFKKKGNEEGVRKCWICGSTEHLKKDCDKVNKSVHGLTAKVQGCRCAGPHCGRRTIL